MRTLSNPNLPLDCLQTNWGVMRNVGQRVTWHVVNDREGETKSKREKEREREREREKEEVVR